MKDEKEQKTNEVVLLQAPQLPMGDLSTQEAVEQALARIEGALKFKDRALQLLLKSARPGAITNMQGKPYLNEIECERLLSMVGGGSVKIQSVTKEKQDGGHYGIQVLIAVTHPTFGSFDGLGYCDSRDQFLGENLDPKTDYRSGQILTDEDGNAIPKRALDDVKEHNIRQQAFTRAKGSAIRKMLALTGMKWEDLEQYGIRPGKGAEVVFGKPQQKPSSADRPATKPTRTPKADPPKAAVPSDVLALRSEISAAVEAGVVSVQEISDVKKEFGFGEDDRVIESSDVAKLTALASWVRNQGKA